MPPKELGKCKEKNQVQRELEEYVENYWTEYDGRMVLACKGKKNFFKD